MDYVGKTKDALKINNDAMDSDTFYQFLVQAFSNLRDVLKPGGAFYIWHAGINGLQFMQACEENELRVRQCLVWNKNRMAFGRQDYQWKHEPCLYGWKDGAGHYFIDDRTNTTVYEDEIDVDKLKKEELKELLKQYLAQPIPTTVINEDKPNRNEDHPTMKPVRLFAWLIRNSSRPGEAVCDLFGGSGTTIVACEQLNRKAYVMEYDPKYCDVIIKRWEALTGQTANKIQGENKNV